MTSKQAESVSKQTIELRRIYAEAPIGLCYFDTDLRYIHINNWLAAINGLEVEKHLGRTIHEVLPHVAEGVESQLRHVIESGQAILGATVELQNMTHTDATRHYEHNYYPVRSGDGTVKGVSCVVQDVTERKCVEETLNEYQRQLRSLASKISLAEEQERRRIAGSLHDHISQELALSRMRLGKLQVSPHFSSAAGAFQNDVREIIEIIDGVIKETRSLVFELSPPILYEFGFEPAVESLADQMHDDHGIICTVRNDERPKPLDDDMKVILFQAVRELLNNATKHSKASRVEISLRRDRDNLQVCIEDNGVGFNLAELEPRLGKVGGFGLFHIREQLDHHGGSLQIDSEPGNGTRVILTAQLMINEEGK